MRRVRHVVRLGPELQVDSLGDGKRPEQAGIQVEDRRRAKDIAARRAEADCCDRGESVRIVVRLPGPDTAQFCNGRQDLVRRLGVIGSIERGARSGDLNGNPEYALKVPFTCQPPSTQETSPF